MSTKKLGLLPRLIIAIVAGILIGNLTRSIHLPLPVQILATFNGVFGNFLSLDLSFRVSRIWVPTQESCSLSLPVLRTVQRCLPVRWPL